MVLVSGKGQFRSEKTPTRAHNSSAIFGRITKPLTAGNCVTYPPKEAYCIDFGTLTPYPVLSDLRGAWMDRYTGFSRTFLHYLK